MREEIEEAFDRRVESVRNGELTLDQAADIISTVYDLSIPFVRHHLQLMLGIEK